MLDVPCDFAFGILDELYNRPFHAEAVFRLRDEWNLSGSARIEHQMVGLQGHDDALREPRTLISTDVLSQNFGGNTKLLLAFANEVWRVAFVFTNVLNQFPIRDQIELDRERPRPRVRLRIVERHQEINVTGIGGESAQSRVMLRYGDDLPDRALFDH